MNVLIYWHDMFFPYSEYLIESFDQDPRVSKLIAAGPKTLVNDPIFSVPTDTKLVVNKTTFEKLNTYKVRPKVGTLGSFIKVIKHHKPDLVIILDEPFSTNVLNAGIANYILRNNATVLFYAFDNLEHSPPYKFLSMNRTALGLGIFLKRTFRILILDKMLQWLRAKVVHGGLTSYSECEDVIINSGWAPKIQEQWWGIPIKKFIQKSQEIDIKLVRNQLEVGEKDFLIGYVGRFVHEKGVLDLVEAIKLLDANCKILLIGDGPIKELIVKKLSNMGALSRVKILPPQNQSNLIAYYSALDLLVLPSRTDYFWKEQYGRVLVEAMACGTAVAGSTSGAIPYVIDDNTMCFPESDPSSIAKVIINYKKNLHINLNANISRSTMGDTQVFINAFFNLNATIDKAQRKVG